MARPTLLLDLDGTLWDSRSWYAEVLARLSHGSVAALENKLASGSSVVELARECAVTKDRFAREASNSVSSLKFYGGVRPTLDSLRDRGSLMGVVTNLPGWLVRPVARAAGIDEHFGVIMTPRPGVPAKPQPHGIRKALAEMGLEAGRQIWFVGDGVVDAGAARAAGVRFAWASYGYEAEPPSGVEIVLRGFEDVLRL